jgi:hypothetical protein
MPPGSDLVVRYDLVVRALMWLERQRQALGRSYAAGPFQSSGIAT